MSAACGRRMTPLDLSTPRVWVVTETSSPLRYGWDGKRLMIVRPGTALAHRRLLWLDRNLPLAAGLVLLVLLLAYRPEAPSVGLVLAILPILGGILTVRRLTRLLRADLHILVVPSADVDNSIEVKRSRILFRECVDELLKMDRDLRQNRITPVEFERRWNDVYESLPRQCAHRTRVS